MKTFSFRLSLVGALLAGGLACAAADYAIVVDKSTFGDAGWKPVVETLRQKHAAEVLVYDGGADKVFDVLPALRKSRPAYVCFVARPEAAGRALVVNAAQLLRRIDDDPFGDALWGIVTGYDAADALRLAKTPKARVIRRGGSSQGLDGAHEAGFGSDECNRNVLWRKDPGGERRKVETGGNIAKALADAFNAIDIDYFVTSGHATQHDWQIIYNRNEGSLLHTKDAKLYFHNPSGGDYPITRASPKIYLAAGNCLIGDLERRDCMATAWIHSGGAEQFCGYTCVTFFGFMGWGVKSLLEGARAGFAEAYYLQNQLLIWTLLNIGDGRLATLELKPEEFRNGRQVEPFLKAHIRDLIKPAGDGKFTIDHNRLGFLWDRDIVAFYGDPAERVTFPAERRAVDVQVKGADVTVAFRGDMTFGALEDVKSARPLIRLLDAKPAGTRLVDAAGRPVPKAVVTERFVIIPVTGAHKKGETLTFRLVK